MKEETKENVGNWRHFESQCREIATSCKRNRKEIGASQKEMAKLIRVSRQTLIDIEAGRLVNLFALFNYAYLVGIDIELTYKQI